MKTHNLVAYFIMMLSVLLCGCKESKEDKYNNITIIGADGKEYTSYQAACNNGDFDAAREFVAQMDKLNPYIGNGNIIEAEEYVHNAEMQYLASLNEEQANNRIVLILNEKKVEGYEAPEGTCLGKHVNKRDLDNYGSLLDDSPAEVKSFREYIEWSGAFNSKCNKLLDIAIACGNESLAKKLLRLFRKDPELLLKNEKIEKEYGDHYYYYDVYAHYTTTSRDADQKKYDEAVKNGAFN